MIPGLQAAEFVRLGSLHRNTYIDSPRALAPSLTLRGSPRAFVAGQLTGVEGYVESTATGLLCGINAARLLEGLEPIVPPATTALGSLIAYVTDRERKDFQPMNANYGLFPPLGQRMRGRDKKQALGQRALAALGDWILETGIENSERVLRTSSC
jgi:methylenetetrahydrofolate--tRNA-(uracil-5-)-methyltransferase